jgi:hypothetical protein
MVLPARKNRGKTQTTLAEEQAKAAADRAEKAATKSKRKLDQCNDSTSTITGDNGDNVEMEVNGGNSTLRRPPRNRRRSLHLRNGENQGGENTSIGGVSAFNDKVHCNDKHLMTHNFIFHLSIVTLILGIASSD